MKITPEDYFIACRNDFATFVGFVFNTLYPSKEYLHNWHVDVMAEQLVQCYEGKCKRLIINMPPRMLKSIVTSVAYPAWILGHNPSAQIMCISYGDELVRELGSLCITLMQSSRYKAVFPEIRLNKRRQSPYNIAVIGGGTRMGVSAGGSITGRGADFIIIDDPLKASDARTKERVTINQWFDDNIYQRLNNKNKGVIVVVMQRLHIDDLSGYLLGKAEKWTLLKLPAIAEEDSEYLLPEGLIHHRKIGQVLHPNLESQEKLETFKANQGPYVYCAQYQQDPASDEEALLQKDWFVIEPRANFPSMDEFHRLYQSWDTANKIEESNDFSVGITVGHSKRHYYILDVIRRRMKYPDLLACIRQCHEANPRAKLIVEDAASGQNIIQSLRGSGIPVKPYKPHGDKFTRLAGVSGIVESRFVHLPAEAPWLAEFLLELTRFPNTKHDDQVDAFSQALHHISERKVGFLDVEWETSPPILPRRPGFR